MSWATPLSTRSDLVTSPNARAMDGSNDVARFELGELLAWVETTPQGCRYAIFEATAYMPCLKRRVFVPHFRSQLCLRVL